MNTKEISSFRKKLNAWYSQHHRDLPWRTSGNPYYIWVSEVMLQQTQVATVIDYFNKFIKRFPDIRSLAHADLQDVLKCWEGLGYYSRARNLHKAVNQLMEEKNESVPDAPEKFIQLPGVGDYINSAVQSIAFGHPLAVVDGNVKRVLSRLFQIDMPVNQAGSHKTYQETASQLLDTVRPGDFNQAMMELGALICKPGKPVCSRCPVHAFCLAYQNNATDTYPRKIKNRKVPVRHLAAGIILKHGKVLIVKRLNDGFLGGLWECPGGIVPKKENADDACIREIKKTVNLTVKTEAHLGRITHAYSHFKIRMDVYLCRYIAGRIRLNGPADYKWIKPEEIGNYPFHKAAHKSFSAFLKNGLLSC